MIVEIFQVMLVSYRKIIKLQKKLMLIK